MFVCVSVCCCVLVWGRRGFTRQPENSKRAHFRTPALQTPPNFNEKDPQVRKERMKIVVRDAPHEGLLKSKGGGFGL